MSLDARDDGSYTHPDDPGEPSTSKPRVSVTDAEGAFLARVALGLRVLEIGTGLGISTGYLASTAAELVTVDIDPWVWDHIWPTLGQEYDNVVFCQHADAVEGPFDVVFIDGDHTPEALRDDIACATTKCPRGLLVAHDANDLHHLLPDWHVIPTTHGLGLRWVGW